MTADLTELEARLAEQDEPHLSPDEYKAVFRQHPAGVAVVALNHRGRPVGFTATSVISVSAAPPLLAFSLASTSSSWPALAEARTLAISFLADHQDDVSARFATSGVDRFAAGGWSSLPTGEPVVDDALSWVRGRVVQRTPVGDSFLVSVRALRSSVSQGTSPLVYHDRTYHRIGDHSAL
ncbi:flavin reductase family protein [Antribacter sp. KLBMP9083]|uniref:Flavin reductase family protein n=1 Tax=Antribacter soli TaxID=2910976 RepID=A0AA41U749_9MICO|nr:flavin reductase family protein [Antribacter soli]MCF4120960.1 flavin reductase family protein [Antribacter soli]